MRATPSGCHPGIGPLRGWAPKGLPLVGPEQVYARKQHVSIIGAMSLDGLIAHMTVRGGVGTRQLLRFVETRLIPVLVPGNIVCWGKLKHFVRKYQSFTIAGLRRAVFVGQSTDRIGESRHLTRLVGFGIADTASTATNVSQFATRFGLATPTAWYCRFWLTFMLLCPRFMSSTNIKTSAFDDGSDQIIGACIEVHRHLGPWFMWETAHGGKAQFTKP